MAWDVPNNRRPEFSVRCIRRDLKEAASRGCRAVGSGPMHVVAMRHMVINSYLNPYDISNRHAERGCRIRPAGKRPRRQPSHAGRTVGQRRRRRPDRRLPLLARSGAERGPRVSELPTAHMGGAGRGPHGRWAAEQGGVDCPGVALDGPPTTGRKAGRTVSSVFLWVRA